MMNFTIDDSNEIAVFQDGQTEPFLLQPYYPDGVPFESKEEATAWAELFIASFEDENPMPPESRGVAGKPKPPVQPVKEDKIYIWDDANLSWIEKDK